MGIFYTAAQPVLPAIQTAIHNALMVPPPADDVAPQDAAARTVNVAQQITPTFNPWRFAGAVLISIALLVVAILTDKSHPDISKALMTSFTSFSGIVLGVLGGEKSAS